MSVDEVITQINLYIKQNNQQLITGQVLNNILKLIVDLIRSLTSNLEFTSILGNDVQKTIPKNTQVFGIVAFNKNASNVILGVSSLHGLFDIVDDTIEANKSKLIITGINPDLNNDKTIYITANGALDLYFLTKKLV